MTDKNEARVLHFDLHGKREKKYNFISYCNYKTHVNQLLLTFVTIKLKLVSWSGKNSYIGHL